MGNFIPRLTIPENGNPYYNTVTVGGYAVGTIPGNPSNPNLNVLNNCVGHAAARFNEIIGKNKWVYFTYPPNPVDWITSAKTQGLKTGNDPKLGAVIVWHRHVAIVEQINSDGSIVTSESGYGCTPSFWTTKRTNSDGNWGGGNSFNFLGFIYQPEEQESEGTDMSDYKKSGIDISYCQTNVNWDKVTADFVIIKAGENNFTDPMYEKHYAGAKSKNIPVGAYWYLDAMNETDAEKEADEFLKRLKGKKFEYPVFLDLENDAQFKLLSKDKVSAIMRAFLTKVEKAGYWVGLYGSYSSLTYYTADDIKSRYSIWLAHWDVQKSPYTGAYGMWQYGIGKNVAGVTGDCDLDYCYVDYPTQIKAKGLNGYGKEPTPTPTPTPTPKKTIDVEIKVEGVTYTGTLTEK